MLRVFTPVALGRAAALVIPYTTVGSSGSASMVLTYHMSKFEKGVSVVESREGHVKKMCTRADRVGGGGKEARTSIFARNPLNPLPSSPKLFLASKSFLF